MRMPWAALILAGVTAFGCDGRLSLFTPVASQAAGAPMVGGGEGMVPVGGMASTGNDGTAAGETSGGAPNEAPLGGAPGGAPLGGAFAEAGAAGSAELTALSIDDFEDHDTHANAPFGWWYQVNDGTATQSIAVAQSTTKPVGPYALRSQGAAFTAWGAVVGVNFKGESVIDVSRFTELRFQARAASGTAPKITLDLIAPGDVRFYAPAITLSDSWTQYRVPLASFKGKNQAPLEPTMLQGMQFELGPSDGFDIWLDDVEFVP